MLIVEGQPNKRIFIQRLTALWALNEAGLGGLMHALRIPFTGILIGGTAVILITLIAYFSQPQFRQILKSMLIVLIIKAVASPHSPINAYFAVIFQGLSGFVLFSLISNLRIASFILALLALIEGAVQKVLVMTLIYGTSLWKAIDLFFDYLLKKFSINPGNFSASFVFIGSYFLLHLLGGIFVGTLCLKFLRLMHHLPERMARIPHLHFRQTEEFTTQQKKKSRLKKFFKLSVLLIFIMGTLTLFSTNSGWFQGLFVFFRVFSLILVWYLFLGPFLIRKLHRFLKNKSQLYSNEIEHIHDILPALKRVVFTLWQHSAQFNYLARWKYFLSNLILITLTFDPSALQETKQTAKKET